MNLKKEVTGAADVCSKVKEIFNLNANYFIAKEIYPEVKSFISRECIKNNVSYNYVNYLLEIKNNE